MKQAGKVTLVGAGPGDGSLLTVRGQQALAQAQVVLIDRLVGPALLSLIPGNAKVIDVGKESGNHKVTQDNINRLILDYAKEGMRVVRLKGGDPYLFGRGAEELEEVVDAGIAFEVVPGISASLAVPAYAGIPVTHRDYSSSVHILTGHGKAGTKQQIDYEALVRVGGTLVFMMGFSAMEEILCGLMKAGMAEGTPAALIQEGTLPGQRKLVSTVAQLTEQAKAAAMFPPAVLVVGQVCRLGDKLDWVSSRPLSGRTTLVTRPQSAGSELGDRLQALGCGVIPFPCIRLEPREQPLPQSFAMYKWLVFTSPFGAETFFQQMWREKRDIRSLAGLRFAAVGSRTAEEIENRGIVVDYLPDRYDVQHLAQGLVAIVEEGERLLLYRAAEGSPDLPAILREHNISYNDFHAYNTLYQNPATGQVLEQLESGRIDWVTFTSASTVEGFVRTVGKEQVGRIPFTAVCIGEQTQQEALRYGMKAVVSDAATIDSMIETILTLKASEEQ